MQGKWLKLKRICSMCGVSQCTSQFYKTGRGRRRGQCKTCIEDQKRWAEFGVLPWDYWNAVYCFSGACAICKLPPENGERLAVDHDHQTGEVRGLLCKPCNLAIGLMKDKVERLASAIIYLGEANAKSRHHRR